MLSLFKHYGRRGFQNGLKQTAKTLASIGADKLQLKNIHMGLFDIFKSKPKIKDNVFGELTILKGFISCRPVFEPLHRNVEVLIMSSENTPTLEQQNFYLELQNNYSEYKAKMTPIIEDTFQNAFDDFKIKNFDKEFKLEAIIIPDFTKKPLEWHISFQSELEPDHTYSVEFIDKNASHLQIDG